MSKQCKKCGGELHREECSSQSMQALGMYWLVCENGCEDPIVPRVSDEREPDPSAEPEVKP